MIQSIPLLGGIELGGTKCVGLIGTGPSDIRAQATVETGGDPARTLERIGALFQGWRAEHGAIAALGIASFGPVDLDRRSSTYGYITSTTKPGWSDTDIAGPLGRFSGTSRVGFDTDVNGAALAEGRWGAAQDLADFAYVTVGTGIGVGLIASGRPVTGFSHGELGHIRPVRKAGDDWAGSCPFHGDCLEGLASGTAIEARLGHRAGTLSSDHPVWDLVAHPLAQLLHTLVLATAPRRILLGGGVMNAQPHLFPRIRSELQRSLNGYRVAPELGSAIAEYIRPPGLGALAGPLGALAVAADALVTP